MNLQQLEYLVALDTYRNFSKAASSCFITQATLSTMIKKLEDELGLVLFDRKNIPVVTTDEGSAIVEIARQVLHQSNRIKEFSSELRGEIEGSMRIGIIPTIAGNLLHRILPTILEKYPKLNLKIQEITTANLVNQLKMGTIDLGVVSTPLKNEDLEEEILYYEKLMVYGNKELNLSAYTSPKEITDEPIWLLEKGNCLSDQIINVCSLNAKKINSNLEFSPNSFDSLLNIVDTMKGLTLLPELYFLDLPDEKKKKVSNFMQPVPVREISLVYHRPYAKLRLINVLADEIRNIIQPILETKQLKSHEMIIAKM